MGTDSLIDGAKRWARTIKRDVVALWIAAHDRRVPRSAKVAAGAVAAYALSPIDLIPDFVPVLGYLDDLLIVPLGILLAVRLIPPMPQFMPFTSCIIGVSPPLDGSANRMPLHGLRRLRLQG